PRRDDRPRRRARASRPQRPRLARGGIVTSETSMHPVVQRVTARVAGRSAASRATYLDRIRRAGEAARAQGPARAHLNCANLAHGFAGAPDADKPALRGTAKPGVAIVTSYNDMLSA